MAKPKRTVVPTEPQSPLEALWREFPQLKNSTLVDYASWATDDGGGMLRTFRLLDGQYVTIESKDDRSTLKPTDKAMVDVLEEIWETLGAKAV